MNVKEISEFLAQRAEEVCKWLLPNGKRSGREWKAGSVTGEAGDSLSVCIAGEKKGLWADFATSEGGDLVDLVCAVMGCSVPAAMNAIESRFGIAKAPILAGEKRSYKRPETPKTVKPISDPVLEFLAKRGINAETAKRFKLASNQFNGRIEIAMPYIRDGEKINIKYRNIANKKETRQESGAEPCLYGWHLIDPKSRRVVITEGEFDCMALNQCGIDALSCNQGAGNHQWIESDYERLNRFDEIVLWYDNDEPGIKGSLEVAKRLGIERIRFVRSKEKDANDTLLAGGADEIYTEIQGAKSIDPDELKSPADFALEVIDEFFPQTEAATGPRLFIGSLQEFLRFRGQEVTTWTGENGHGKSAFLGYQTISMMDQGHKVCVFSGEMKARKLLYRYIRQLTATDKPDRAFIEKAMAYLQGNLYIYNHLGNAPIDRLIEVFSYAAKRYAVTQFVIDSLMMTDVPEDGPGFMEKQRTAVTKLMAFAARFDVHVHLVAHPRKLQDGRAPTKNDIAGSSKIANLSHNVCAVQANFQKEGLEPDGSFFLYKQRNGDVQYRKCDFSYFAKGMQYEMDSSIDGMRWV